TTWSASPRSCAGPSPTLWRSAPTRSSTTSASTSRHAVAEAHRIVALPGDGIGPEIMAAARELLDRLGGFEVEEHLVGGAAFDACSYEVGEIERIAEVAFRFARRRVTSVDKANVLETSRLWREVVERVAERHEGTELEHLLVDNAAMQLVARPAAFDVIL